ncbi:MAG TPA: MFS transporter [Stellaceae bacterium]|nr:MFS transporter [Stellaceae bacterium]
MAYRTSTARAEGYPSLGFAWYALICLVLCYFMYFVDRNILTLLVAPVRRDLGINDSQMGILQGYSFSVLNGLMAIPFGWYADRKSRRAVLVFSLALWGLSTIASGFTTSFTQLMFTRMGLGIGEAGLMPAAFSLISDYFPKAQRGRAVGVFGIGGFGGIGLSYLIGGAVLAAFRGVDTVSLPVVGTTSLWHAAFMVVGLITLVLAAMTATVREPPRHDTTKEAIADGEPFFRYFQQHWLAFTLVMGGYICLGFCAIGWFAWLPTYFIREFKMAPIAAGVQVGTVTTISGVLGAVAGGYIADWMARRGLRGGKLLTLTVMFVMWIPCALGLWLSNDPLLSLLCVFVFTFMDGIGFMQYGNVVQEMFPPHLRARSIAAWAVCSSTLSYGLGPLAFGLATDYVFGASGLRSAISLVSMPVILLGLALSWWGRKPYDRARHASDPSVGVDIEWAAAARPLAAAARSS